MFTSWLFWIFVIAVISLLAARIAHRLKEKKKAAGLKSYLPPANLPIYSPPTRRPAPPPPPPALRRATRAGWDSPDRPISPEDKRPARRITDESSDLMEVGLGLAVGLGVASLLNSGEASASSNDAPAAGGGSFDGGGASGEWEGPDSTSSSDAVEVPDDAGSNDS